MYQRLKAFAAIFGTCGTLWGGSYYARLQPYDSVVLKAAVSAQVVDVNLSAEGKRLPKGAVLIRLDDKLDRLRLKRTREKIALLQEMVRVNETALPLQKENLDRLKENYRRISALSTASKTQKDNAFSAYASAFAQYTALEEKVLSLRSQLLNAKDNADALEESIAKKRIAPVGKYVYNIAVRAGDFVAPGTPLARTDDLHKGKLVVFLDPEDVPHATEKTVYLDGNRTDYHVSKVWRVSDERLVSSYRGEIIVDVPEKETFSKLIKVELK